MAATLGGSSTRSLEHVISLGMVVVRQTGTTSLQRLLVIKSVHIQEEVGVSRKSVTAKKACFEGFIYRKMSSSKYI